MLYGRLQEKAQNKNKLFDLAKMDNFVICFPLFLYKITNIYCILLKKLILYYKIVYSYDYYVTS